VVFFPSRFLLFSQVFLLCLCLCSVFDLFLTQFLYSFPPSSSHMPLAERGGAIGDGPMVATGAPTGCVVRDHGSLEC
jgi:hypothetical protein